MGPMLPLLTLLLVQTCFAATVFNAVAPWVFDPKQGVPVVWCYGDDNLECHSALCTSNRCADHKSTDPVEIINLGNVGHEADLCGPGYFAEVAPSCFWDWNDDCHKAGTDDCATYCYQCPSGTYSGSGVNFCKDSSPDKTHIKWGRTVCPGNGRYNGNGRHWETPPEVFGPLHAEFDFTLDPCAMPATI